MIKRGRILRDTNAGAGLISVDGQKYELQLEKHWDCDALPELGAVVEIELDDSGQLIAAWAVDEKELMKEQAAKVFDKTKQTILVTYESLSASVGKPVLIATLAVFLGWFIFNSVSIKITANSSASFTFWEMLSFAGTSNLLELMSNATSDGLNMYHLLAIAALGGPFLFLFWKNPLAYFGNCLALALMLFFAISSYLSIQDQWEASKQTMSAFGGTGTRNMMDSFAKEMMNEFWKYTSFGLGVYLASLGSLYLAFVGVKNYLLSLAKGGMGMRNSGASGSGRRSGRKSHQPSSVPVGNEMKNRPAKSIELTCPACNASYDSGDAFCGSCGNKLSA